MNENLNLCQILKDCPKGTKLWSPVWGDVVLKEIKDGSSIPIKLTSVCSDLIALYPNGKMYDLKEAECVLFPSKDQRDWSKFKAPVKRFNPEEFKPFDKVLLCDKDMRLWIPGFFGSLLKDIDGKYVVVELISEKTWKQCIPYNNETKELVSTGDDCPDYYKWWED